jgi:hypothetical protein
MKYQVKTFRDAGLEARWTKSSKGQPFIVLRDPNGRSTHQRENWYVCHDRMWKSMLKYEEEGAEDFIRKAYDGHTLLADIFSISI